MINNLIPQVPLSHTHLHVAGLHAATLDALRMLALPAATEASIACEVVFGKLTRA